MNIRVKILEEKYEEKYSEFLRKCPNTLFTASNKYRKLLKAFLGEPDVYFIAVDDRDEIIGVLPSFLKKNNRYGPVLNSLPFYGSSGGIITENNEPDIKKCLIRGFYDYALKNNCITTTIITSPFEEDPDFYRKHGEFDTTDFRTGQIVPLPEQAEGMADKIMSVFEQRTRTAIRKAIKNDITVVTDFSPGNFKYLYSTHWENITAKGGIAKPPAFFHRVESLFKYEEEFKIYTAIKDGQSIAAMLIFYCYPVVEEFCLGITLEFRHLQPLSLLLYTAFLEAVNKGFKWWNFGGTWKTQEDLYLFKRSWGAQDFPYYYYTKIFDETVLNLAKETLLKEYPYFYVVHFDNLKNGG